MTTLDHLDRELKRVHDELAKVGRKAAAETDSQRLAQMQQQLMVLGKRRNELQEARRKAWEDESAELLQQRQEREKVQFESATFWSRRFFVTLALANAGAFVAMTSGLIQADRPAEVAALVTPAMIHFAWGMLASGSIPLFFWGEYLVRDFRGTYFNRNIFQEKVLPIVQWVTTQAVYFATVVGIWQFAQGLFTALGSAQAIIKH